MLFFGLCDVEVDKVSDFYRVIEWLDFPVFREDEKAIQNRSYSTDTLRRYIYLNRNVHCGDGSLWACEELHLPAGRSMNRKTIFFLSV